MQLKCSNCESVLFVGQIKYHTPDKMHVFCDAYCSNEWYASKFEKLQTQEIKDIVKKYRKQND